MLVQVHETKRHALCHELAQAFQDSSTFYRGCKSFKISRAFALVPGVHSTKFVEKSTARVEFSSLFR